MNKKDSTAEKLQTIYNGLFYLCLFFACLLILSGIFVSDNAGLGIIILLGICIEKLVVDCVCKATNYVFQTKLMTDKLIDDYMELKKLLVDVSIAPSDEISVQSGVEDKAKHIDSTAEALQSINNLFFYLDVIGIILIALAEKMNIIICLMLFLGVWIVKMVVDCICNTANYAFQTKKMLENIQQHSNASKGNMIETFIDNGLEEQTQDAKEAEKKYGITDEDKQEKTKIRAHKKEFHDKNTIKTKRIIIIKKSIVFSIGLIVITVFCVIAVQKYVIPFYNYYKAAKLIDEEKYAEALDAFSDMGDYMRASEYRCIAEMGMIKEKEIGDQVSFGEKEEYGWIILQKNNQNVLLISNRVVARKPYCSLNGKYTWEDSSLRDWLNSTFIDETFSEAEIDRLNTVTNKGDYTERVNDRAYVLSVEEAEQFFCSQDKLKAFNIIGQNEGWWLRTKGNENNTIAFVRRDGSISLRGANADGWNGIRPVISLSLAEE